jgi:hypothetical protein
MEQTLEDYLFGLAKFKETAYENGDVKLGDFLTNLINAPKDDIDVKLCDVMYHNFDGLNDTEAEIFTYFFNKGAPKEWYEAVIYINEQRQDCSDYLPVIKRAYENGLSADDVINVERRTSGVEDFVELVENTILKFGVHSDEKLLDAGDNKLRIENEFIRHLKQENERLQQERDSALTDLEALQSAHRTTIKESVDNKHIAADCRQETDNLKEELKKAEIERQRYERKYLNQKSFAENLSSVNDSLLAEKKSLADEKHSLLGKIDGYISEKEQYVKDKERLESENTALITDRDNAIREKEEALASRDALVEKYNKLLTDFEAGMSENSRLAEEITMLRSRSGNEQHPVQMEYAPQASVQIPDYSSANIDYNAFGFADERDYPEAPEADIGNYIPFNPQELPQEESSGQYVEYDTDSLIVIDSSKESLNEKKHKFAKSFRSAFNRLFVNIVFNGKSVEDQNNLIFAKLVEANYPRDVTKQVALALRTKPNVSRATIYKLLQKSSPEDEVLSYCMGL